MLVDGIRLRPQNGKSPFPLKVFYRPLPSPTGLHFGILRFSSFIGLGWVGLGRIYLHVARK